MQKPIYITTSIPYVNARPHIGHAQEFILADCIVRLYRQRGHSVTFQTGTDENASKNVVAAAQAGVSTQEFVDKNAAIFQDLVRRLDVTTDTFIRTTEYRHRLGVEKFWSELKPDDLYVKSYEGHYCVGCEDFLLEKDLANGVCPDHNRPPERVREENIFFRLSAYQAKLETLIAEDHIKIIPETRKNEVLSFVRRGLTDISVTRAKARTSGWGISVPGRDDQVIYVWIDALINYLSGQGFGEDNRWQSVWNSDTQKIHVIGKNVWKFHAIYWPALLLSAGLPLPNEIVIHGFLTNNGTKISKSLGNAIDPLEVLDKFGSDALRHFLLSRTPIYSDSDFSIERLTQTYASDLAHRLGNLFSRLVTLCDRSGLNVPLPLSASEVIHPPTSPYSIHDVSKALWSRLDALNAELSDRRPWILLQHDPDHRLLEWLIDWCQRLYSIALELEAFLPRASLEIKTALEGGNFKCRILFPLKKPGE
ncbi:MAG: methionine--tRNA ligase [Oligoflexales bacterium]